jgi:hypothetical protein
MEGVVKDIERVAELIIDQTVDQAPTGELALNESQKNALRGAIYWAIGYSNNLMMKIPQARHGALRHALAVLAMKKLNAMSVTGTVNSVSPESVPCIGEAKIEP